MSYILIIGAKSDIAKEVAEDIYNAQQKNESLLYTKWIWRYVMMIIKMIPGWKFKGMSI